MEPRSVLNNSLKNDYIVFIYFYFWFTSESELNQFIETKVLGELKNHFASSNAENEATRRASLYVFVWVNYRKFLLIKNGFFLSLNILVDLFFLIIVLAYKSINIACSSVGLRMCRSNKKSV